MQGENYDGSLNLNAEVTLMKNKDNSLLANCSHLRCENAIHSPMLTGLLSEIVKDLNKKSKCIYPT